MVIGKVTERLLRKPKKPEYVFSSGASSATLRDLHFCEGRVCFGADVDVGDVWTFADYARHF